jgi:hypothetical protein
MAFLVRETPIFTPIKGRSQTINSLYFNHDDRRYKTERQQILDRKVAWICSIVRFRKKC